MAKQIGLWIDHRRAFIVDADATVGPDGEAGDSGKQIQFEGPSHENGSSSSDGRDKRSGEYLGRFYDEVIESLGGAKAVLIMGPGDAKTELNKRLESLASGERSIEVKPADRMTDDQITAEVRRYFREMRPGSSKKGQEQSSKES